MQGIVSLATNTTGQIHIKTDNTSIKDARVLKLLKVAMYI